MSVSNGAYTRTNSFGSDGAKLFPRFKMVEIQDHVATASAGRPIFKQEERVEIIMPGNPYTRPVRRVTDEDKQRWAQEYEAFIKGQNIALNGTPLEEWPILNRAMIAELKALEIHTVEQLSELSDLAIQRVGMGGRALRDRAKAYMDDAVAVALQQQTDAENAKLRSEMEAMKMQNNALQETMERMSTQLLQLQNMAPAAQTYIPGMHDPMEQMKQGAPAEPIAESALASLDRPRRGRPRKEA